MNLRHIVSLVSFVAICTALMMTACQAKPIDMSQLLPNVDKNTVTIVGYGFRYHSQVPSEVALLAESLAKHGVTTVFLVVSIDDAENVKAITDSKAGDFIQDPLIRDYGKTYPMMLRAIVAAGIKVIPADLSHAEGIPKPELRNKYIADQILAESLRNPKAKFVLLASKWFIKPVGGILVKHKLTVGSIEIDEGVQPMN